ncbi:MAG: tetratricopeptide (TPR) repeat protein [Myxococcota bacterium]|jgi:tetratricopeptide (TPR) repeat protein
MVSLMLLLACGSPLRHIQPPPVGPTTTLPPYRARALYLAGSIAMERGDPETAVEAFSRASLLDPDSDEVLVALADAQEAAGDADGAQETRERTEERQSD